MSTQIQDVCINISVAFLILFSHTKINFWNATISHICYDPAHAGGHLYSGQARSFVRIGRVLMNQKTLLTLVLKNCTQLTLLFTEMLLFKL